MERHDTLAKRLAIRRIGSPLTQVQSGGCLPIAADYMSDGVYTIDVTLDSQPLVSQDGVQVTDGNFIFWVQIPEDTDPGSHQICTSSQTGHFCFDIPVCTDNCAPIIGFLQNNMATQSAIVVLQNGATLVGDGFTPYEAVSMALDPPDGPWLNWTYVDDNGHFNVGLSFDSSESLGAHQVEVTGWDKNGLFTGDDVVANFSLVQVINFRD